MATTFDPRTNYNGAKRRRRSLEVPPPPGQREIVVGEALQTLERKRKEFIDKVEDAIDDNGLTIEVARLRDRLTKLALGDTERLLLATPGVTEMLFYKAIEEELEDDDYDYDYELVSRLANLLGTRGKKGTGQSASAPSRSTGKGARATKATASSTKKAPPKAPLSEAPTRPTPGIDEGTPK